MATKINTYAYELDKKHWKEFAIMLRCENWEYDMYLQSKVLDPYGPNGREDSRWYCQLHRDRHSEIVDNPLFWSDRKWQIEQCYNKRKNWTIFHGPNRPIYKDIKWKRVFIGLCKDVVKNDFTIKN